MIKIWRDVEYYEGLYLVSNFGEVKSLTRKGPNNSIRPERVLKQILDKKGYLQVGLSKNNSTRTMKVHRLVAMAFIPNPCSKPQVNHKDGIKAHNEDYNLEWATPSENVKHAYDKLGLNRRGENNGRVKLTKEQVCNIRRSRMTNKRLAKIYKVCESTVSRVKNNRSWEHV